MIIFKSLEDRRDFTKVNKKLKRIVNIISNICDDVWSDDIVVTSIVRNDASTHNQKEPYRFIDLAIPYHAGIDGAEALRNFINKVFPYDLSRPKKETIPALDHGTAPHLHIQVNS